VSVSENGSKTRLAKELGVSRASLYYRHKMPEKDENLRKQIEAVMAKNPGYGSTARIDSLGHKRQKNCTCNAKIWLKTSQTL